MQQCQLPTNANKYFQLPFAYVPAIGVQAQYKAQPRLGGTERKIITTTTFANNGIFSTNVSRLHFFDWL